jgi:hypothetical protein
MRAERKITETKPGRFGIFAKLLIANVRNNAELKIVNLYTHLVTGEIN